MTVDDKIERNKNDAFNNEFKTNNNIPQKDENMIAYQTKESKDNINIK